MPLIDTTCMFSTLLFQLDYWPIKFRIILLFVLKKREFLRSLNCSGMSRGSAYRLRTHAAQLQADRQPGHSHFFPFRRISE